MKKLLFILFLVAISFATKAQSATFTYDATNDISIQGGDGTGKIVGTQWSIVGTPPSVVQFTNPDSKKLTATVTKDGTYTFQLKVTDDSGNVATATLLGIAYAKQVIIINLKVTKISAQIK
jgi:hypothetical protein